MSGRGREASAEAPRGGGGEARQPEARQPEARPPPEVRLRAGGGHSDDRRRGRPQQQEGKRR
jgi:hypothetical protein